ncbi:hypothetical protein L0657_17875 [Dyadobacter sp. CY345]|uniref:hypothetical protein n=1 Tax=Dyadobacter sp. CY345 TaxID=2909335 RepID=UPI001F19E292|nr:hypothetical protein [Dyadobacter sp. CY345]MCF2445835.1 hypothetical protein [Dyadobacter sp. CY345]
MKIVKKVIIWKIMVVGLFVTATTSCSSYNTESTKIDSVLVIETGIEYVFETQKFNPNYYIAPIKIIKSAYIPDKAKFSINGKQCEVIDKLPDSLHKNIFKPLPFIEISEFKLNQDKTIELGLIFRATGHWFKIKMKPKQEKSWQVEAISEATI